MPRTPLHFTHNGQEAAVFVEGGDSLLTVLRERIGDMTPKYGCGQGGCGACTVLVDGALRLACLTLAETVEGASVDTLAAVTGPDALQEAFMENFAAQCGYCTPGMIVAARKLLADNPQPSREDVAEAIAGNLCRCTGYEPIIDAIMAAAEGRASA